MTTWKTFCAAALALGLSALAASAHVMPLTDRQIAAGSSDVVVAVVETATTRWNEQRTLLFTDYSLRVEERLRGDAPDRITVSIPGGTLDGQTHATCASIPLDTGARYLLFLEDLDRPLLMPFTGGAQGVFRDESASGARAASGELSRLVRSARALLEQVERKPRASDTDWLREAENPALTAKRWDPSSRPVPAGFEPSLVEPVAAAAGLPYFVDHPVVAPLVFDPLPADSPFHGVDQQMMAYWNLYLKKPLFLVNRDPSPGWAYNNGVSEMAGFPADSEMKEQFGIGWSAGFYSAILYIWGPDGRTTEVDIAMNPNREWILGEHEPAVQFLRGSVAFKPLILNHLGGAWGLKGLFHPDQVPEDPAARTVDTVSGAPGDFTFATLMAVDTAAARATFGGKRIRDGLVSSYSLFVNEEGFLAWAYAAPSVESARAGTGFAFTAPIKIENPGTVTLNRPMLEVYLVPSRGSLDGAVLLKRLTVQGSLKSGATRRVDLGQATVPAGTPAGTYHFAFVLRDRRDAYQGNNRAWSHPEITLAVTR